MTSLFWTAGHAPSPHAGTGAFGRGEAVAASIDRWAGAVAVALLIGWAALGMMESRRLDEAKAASPAKSDASRSLLPDEAPEMLIGAFGGKHYSYPSDVRFRRFGPGPLRDFTVKDVAWEGQSFKHPLYYGVRVARWGHGGEGPGRFGGMVDFIHSKAIAQMGQELRLEGRLDGKPVPDKARIGDLFSKLEFSHGHNMLLFTGLMRLASLAPRVSPYVGLGAGVSFPHTEIHITKSDPTRTYEYQFTGPAVQGLAGVEFRLPRVSLFLEYKFTFATYSAPLTGREGTYFPQDIYLQIRRWLSGESPAGGYADTRLSSHQLIGGLGVRVGGPVPAN